MNTKAQSTVEYIVLFAAVTVVVIIFLVGDKSPFQAKLGGTLDKMAGSMESMTDRLTTEKSNEPVKPVVAPVVP